MHKSCTRLSVFLSLCICCRSYSTGLQYIIIIMLPNQAIASTPTGLQYKDKGLGTSSNATRRSYGSGRRKRDLLGNLGAGVNITEIAQVACGQNDITHPKCSKVLLLALTPAAYSSNNTADTPGRRGFISPAQVRQTAM
jgi:hypothetical protein